MAQTAESNGTVRIQAESPSANISKTVSDPVAGVTNTYAWTNTKRQKVLYYTSRLSGYIKGGWPDDYLSWESGGSRN
jgi:hypothetical protein